MVGACFRSVLTSPPYPSNLAYPAICTVHACRYELGARELMVVGGGSQNQLWRRVLADAFQLPLRFPLEPESAALGAALQVRGTGYMAWGH